MHCSVVRLVVGIGFVLSFATTAGTQNFSSHEDAERNYRSPAAKYATGTALNRSVTYGPLYMWPVKVLSIGHTIASYQNYGSGAYFHHGLDIRADAGSDVVASVGGKVVNIENYMSGSAYWEIAILDDDGYVWQYHHVDPNSIPQNIHNAFKNGTKIATGTKIGEVYYWSEVSFGERYHHIHLNVLGAGESYLSAFAFLSALADTASPQIQEIYLVQNGRRVTGTAVSGNYTVAAVVTDLVLHDQFTVPPHSIFYQLDGKSPFMVWSFHWLPGGASNTQYVNNFFIADTCGNYTCRKAVVDLGFRKTAGQVFPTTSGAHSLVLRAADFVGNMAEKTFSWTVN